MNSATIRCSNCGTNIEITSRVISSPPRYVFQEDAGRMLNLVRDRVAVRIEGGGNETYIVTNLFQGWDWTGGTKITGELTQIAPEWPIQTVKASQEYS